jgi:hypothetical protein
VSKKIDPRRPEAIAAPEFHTPKQVINDLKSMYMEKLLPMEKAYKFGEVRVAGTGCCRFCSADHPSACRRPGASGGLGGQRTSHNAHTQQHTMLLFNGVSAGNKTAAGAQHGRTYIRSTSRLTATFTCVLG